VGKEEGEAEEEGEEGEGFQLVFPAPGCSKGEVAVKRRQLNLHFKQRREQCTLQASAQLLGVGAQDLALVLET
jgi:hypothetical protein